LLNEPVVRLARSKEVAELKDTNVVEITAHIVAAYVQNNPVPAAGLPDLIASVSEAIGKFGRVPRTERPKLEPAVDPKKSVLYDHIVCLEDGKSFTSLKRHLRDRHGMTPDEYRSKWGLPSDYPMNSPVYSAVRSTLAIASGFGRKPLVR
jgi:predicted transcriptional regulator